MLRAAAETSSDRIVLVDNDVRLDCATLHAQAGALAAALLARMPAGSVVSFMLPNWHESAVIYLAATLAGMVVNLILPVLRDHDLRFILEDAGTAMIFVPQRHGGHDYEAMLERVTAAMDSAPEVVVLRGAEAGHGGPHTSYRDLLGQAPNAAALPTLDPDAVRMILYTSGTTSRPKGVLHTHNSLYALICQLREHWNIDPGDTFLVPRRSPISGLDLCLRMPAAAGDDRGADGPVGPGAGDRADEHRTVHPHGRGHAVPAAAALGRRARRHPPARPEGVHLRRRVGLADADPARRTVFRSRRLHPGVRLHRGARRDRRRTRPDEAEPAADTDGRAGIAEIKLVAHEAAPAGEGKSACADPRCWWATAIPKTTLSMPQGFSAPGISAGGSRPASRPVLKTGISS